MNLLRRLLALLTVSAVCVIGSAGQAAAVDYGPWTGHAVTASGPISLPDKLGGFLSFDCRQMMRYSSSNLGGVIEAAAGGDCSGGPDVTPGWCGIGEVGCTEFYWEFHGPNCGSLLTGFPRLSPGISSHPGDSSASVKFTLGAASVAVLPPLCDPTEVCAQLDGGGFSSGTRLDGCAPSGLNPPALPASTHCAYGDILAAFSDDGDAPGSTGGPWYTASEFKYGNILATKGAPIGSPTGSTTWVTYAVMKSASGSTGQTNFGETQPAHFRKGVQGGSLMAPYNTGGEVWADLNWNVLSGVRSSKNNWLLPPHGSEPSDAGKSILLGIGVMRVQNWDDPRGSSGFSTGGSWPVNDPNGHLAWFAANQPGRCAFYFGAKIWDQAGTTVDDPAGTIDDIPEPGGDDPPPLPDPEDDPPEDDDGGWWWAQIIAWLKRIWGAISALDFPDFDFEFPDLLGLFVPEEGFFDGEFTDVKQAWRDSGPGSFITGFSEMGVTWPASGCSGIPVNFSMGSTHVDFNIGAACSGSTASAASIVKLTVSASLVLFGGLAAVRSIGAGFGWSPGIGKGGETS